MWICTRMCVWERLSMRPHGDIASVLGHVEGHRHTQSCELCAMRGMTWCCRIPRTNCVLRSGRHNSASMQELRVSCARVGVCRHANHSGHLGPFSCMEGGEADQAGQPGARAQRSAHLQSGNVSPATHGHRLASASAARSGVWPAWASEV